MKSVLDLEKKYKDILENFEEWSYIRLRVGFYLKNIDNESIRNYKKDNWIRKLKKIIKIKNIFYGIKNWFNKYDYLFFSDSGERKLIEGKYKDKIMDDLIDVSNKKSLLIETLNENNYKRNIYTRYFVSDTLLLFAGKIISFFMKKKLELKEIEKILNINQINIDYKKSLKQAKALEIVYKILLKIYQPEKVFVNCYYCRLPLVKICNELNIPIVDVQHGVISKEHFGYISDIKIDKNYIANELLSFGENEKKIKNLMIKIIYPIGSYYLIYLQENFKKNLSLLNLKKNYEYFVGVSMQDQEWEYLAMINFINKIAKVHKNVLFLIIPRIKRDYFHLIKEENIKIITNLDCYNTIMHCDIHMTLYSTCALEAPTLGIPNILVDVNDMATKYYKNLLNNYHTKIIKKEKEFSNVLEQLINLNPEEIKKANKNVFVPNYRERVNKYFKFKDNK